MTFLAQRKGSEPAAHPEAGVVHAAAPVIAASRIDETSAKTQEHQQSVLVDTNRHYAHEHYLQQGYVSPEEEIPPTAYHPSPPAYPGHDKAPYTQ